MAKSKKPLSRDINWDVPDLSATEWQETLVKATVKRGRPGSHTSMVSVTILLSPDVLEYFRASSLGWQTSIDETLRKATGLDR